MNEKKSIFEKAADFVGDAAEHIMEIVVGLIVIIVFIQLLVSFF